MYDFVETLKNLFRSEEYNYSKSEAEKLIKTHPKSVIVGIMSNYLRATAMALTSEGIKTEGIGIHGSSMGGGGKSP